MTFMKDQVEKIFRKHFGEPALVVRSPGRINLIGEHTDYNLGFVLPAAIDRAIYIAIRKRTDREVHLVAGDLDETATASLDALSRTGQHWPDYILGVADQFQKAGLSFGGFDAVLMGDVPLGAGLSSSAAVECATAFALNELFGLNLQRLPMAQYAQHAENDFVGLKCGIMDQFASMFGKKEQLIKLDCRSLEYAYMPFSYDDISILLFDTGVKHSLASSAYNTRREECEAGVATLQKKYPGVKSLRDATPGMVEELLAQGDQNIYKRCKYVVEEIGRLQHGCDDLLRHDLVSFGRRMFETHEGLSRLYEVSCPEADALVGMVREDEAVLGARMMGGGFGGCTINLVKKERAEGLVRRVTAMYIEQFRLELKTYAVSIAEGTSVV